MTGVETVGRDEERATVRAFVAEEPEAPSGLVLEGEAGIGKSTLWLEGVGVARARGLRVLSSRPAEAERALAHVGLGDLLEDVLDEALPMLALPRRAALGVAMLQEQGTSSGWARASAGRPCSASRSSRGATRSSRWSWPESS